ncbi:MAG: hypothetical protein ACKVRN_16685 [Pyrinomonadaceae bacterium]
MTVGICGHEPLSPATRAGFTNCNFSTGLHPWLYAHTRYAGKLGRNDYIRCLEFAIESFYSYASSSNFGTSTQRDAGKFVTDFTIGKLGEVALQKFLKARFDVEISLDFTMRKAIVGQDIVEIAPPRKGGRVFNPIRKRVAIKTSKLKNVWLIVPEKEVVDVHRTSDIYIFSRVDLFFDHLIRFLRDHKSLKNVKSKIPAFVDMSAEICGFIKKSTLMAKGPTTDLPGQKTEIQRSYIRRTGELQKTEAEWIKLLATL